MNFKFWCLVILFSLVSLTTIVDAKASEDIFAKISFEEAKQQAVDSKKLLLLDFSAEWCPPCQEMELRTWSDSDVQEWMKENVVALQIDPQKSTRLFAKLGVEFMPTLLLFTPCNNYEEFGRRQGFVGPADLLHWLKGAKAGQSAAELEANCLNKNKIWERISKARELQSAGKAEEALDEFIWLWRNIGGVSSDLAMVRKTMIPHEIKNICKANAEAKTKVSNIRDAAEKDKKWQDWVILNGVLSENKRTLEWFDKAKADPELKPQLPKYVSVLAPVLYSNSRWADAAEFLYPQPLDKLDEIFKQAEYLKKPRPHTEVAKDFDPFPSMVIMLYGSYLGAGRDEEAKQIEEKCLKLDDTEMMRNTLSSMAKAMRQARQTKTK